MVEAIEEKGAMRETTGSSSDRMDGMVPRPSTLSRFRGCLLGLAIGDALGMPVEGARASSIRSRLGEVRDFLPAPWRDLRAGQWTDDTKMALCLARSITETGKVDPADMAGKLLQWMDSGDWRGMSDAVYSSLKRLREGAPLEKWGEEGDKAVDSASLLRTVPVALLRCRDAEALRRDVEASCFITHRHPEALAASLAAAFAVSRAALGELEPQTLLRDAALFAESSSLRERLSLAGSLLEKGAMAAEAVLRLGISGKAVETVSAALFCFLSHPRDFEEALVAAASGGSHADEIAALTGAISGAFLGEEAIPTRWLSGVERASEIADIAEALYALFCRGV